jgi:hypothetical protein
MSSATCRVRDGTPGTAIQNPFSITETMIRPLQGLYRFLPKGACIYDRTLNLTNEKPIEFFIDGSGIHLGDKQWPIASDSEVVVAYARDEKIYGDHFEFTDPGFYFMGKRGKTDLYIDYARNMGILKFIAVEENESMIECAFTQQSSKL